MCGLCVHHLKVPVAFLFQGQFRVQMFFKISLRFLKFSAVEKGLLSGLRGLCVNEPTETVAKQKMCPHTCNFACYPISSWHFPTTEAAAVGVFLRFEFGQKAH